MSHERSGPEELRIVLERLWDEVLPILQPQADGAGFGPEWRVMCEAGTARAALAAAQAAEAAGAKWASVAAAQASEAAAAAARATNWPTWVAAAAQAHEAKMAAQLAGRHLTGA